MFFWLGIEGELALAHDAVGCGERSEHGANAASPALSIKPHQQQVTTVASVN